MWVVYEYSQRYLTLTSMLIGTFLIVGMISVIALLIAEAHEWAEARWSKARRRTFERSASARVSESVDSRADAQRTARTWSSRRSMRWLGSTTRTSKCSSWTTTRRRRRPGARSSDTAHGSASVFASSTSHRLRGFKAGALNYALRETSPAATIIAVIDSDYKVDPSWLVDLVPAFVDEKVAIVQAPQDYRDEQESAFKAMCYAEYRGFFHIGMITRNERNAIIQHGTMTLVRRAALDHVGGWAEWCITEDAELGLRLFEHGHEAQYLPRSYGRGLMPETFGDYKKQRFRWAYGAMQILRRHEVAAFLLARPAPYAGTALSLHRGLAAVAGRRPEPHFQCSRRSCGRSR